MLPLGCEGDEATSAVDLGGLLDPCLLPVVSHLAFTPWWHWCHFPLCLLAISQLSNMPSCCFIACLNPADCRQSLPASHTAASQLCFCLNYFSFHRFELCPARASVKAGDVAGWELSLAPVGWSSSLAPGGAASGGQGCKGRSMERSGRMDRQTMWGVLLGLRKFHRLFERRWRSSVLRGEWVV